MRNILRNPDSSGGGSRRSRGFRFAFVASSYRDSLVAAALNRQETEEFRFPISSDAVITRRPHGVQRGYARKPVVKTNFSVVHAGIMDPSQQDSHFYFAKARNDGARKTPTGRSTPPYGRQRMRAPCAIPKLPTRPTRYSILFSSKVVKSSVTKRSPRTLLLRRIPTCFC